MLQIICGSKLTQPQQTVAIDVLYYGFFNKINSLFLLTKNESQARRMIRDIINIENSIVVFNDDKIVGIALLESSGNKSFKFDWVLMHREFGIFGAILRRCNYWFIHGTSRSDNELHIKAITILENFRNQGVGSYLLSEIESFAKDSKFDQLTLEVIDSNPAAKRLYERLGFTTYRTVSTWPHTSLSGFRSFDCMIKHI